MPVEGILTAQPTRDVPYLNKQDVSGLTGIASTDLFRFWMMVGESGYNVGLIYKREVMSCG
jgi:hypothetical protein